jgi:hypothetical protein
MQDCISSTYTNFKLLISGRQKKLSVPKQIQTGNKIFEKKKTIVGECPESRNS